MSAKAAGQPVRKLSVAPMMDRTDRHFRYFMRLLARRTWLYTEMVPTGAILHGDTDRHLKFDQAEHPVALQLGGSDPQQLAEAAVLGEKRGYDEINLNVGCPSNRVQHANFGAALMLDRPLVTRCIAAMRDRVAIPVTVKTRLGVDHCDSYEFTRDFVGALSEVGCSTVILHARKAWLQGLSPKQNREIPPLDYQRVFQIKREFPKLEIIINGGISDIDTALRCSAETDGVMLGRAAVQNPMLVAQLDAHIYGGAVVPRMDALRQYLIYADKQVRQGQKLRYVLRHVLGLFAGEPGGRHWRRVIGSLPDGDPGLGSLTRFLDRSADRGRLDPRDLLVA